MLLEEAKDGALQLLAEDGGEVSLGPYDQHIWLGVGYCVAKGWATYRGDNHYRITAAGVRAYKELGADVADTDRRFRKR